MPGQDTTPKPGRWRGKEDQNAGGDQQQVGSTPNKDHNGADYADLESSDTDGDDSLTRNGDKGSGQPAADGPTPAGQKASPTSDAVEKTIMDIGIEMKDVTNCLIPEGKTDIQNAVTIGVDERSPDYNYVHFMVVAPPSFKIGENESLGIVFENKKLGGWKHIRVIMWPMKRFESGFVLHAANVSLPKEIKGSEYKYVIARNGSLDVKSDDDYEKLHWHRYSSSVNRILRIPENYVGDWFQVDGCCHPQKMDHRTWAGRMGDAVIAPFGATPTFRLADVLTNDYIAAWHYLLPKLDVRESAISFKFWFDIDTMKRSDSGGSVNTFAAAQMISSLVRALSSASDDRKSTLERPCFTKEIEESLYNFMGGVGHARNHIFPNERVSVAFAILESVRTATTNGVKLADNIFINLCRLFATVPPSHGTFVEILSDWFDDEKRGAYGLEDARPPIILSWLIEHMMFHPATMALFPLCRAVSVAQFSTAAPSKSVRWWLPEILNVKLSRPCPVPIWKDDFSVVMGYVKENKYIGNIDTDFVGSVLRFYCSSPEQATIVIDCVTEFKPEHLLAWCYCYLRSIKTPSDAAALKEGLPALFERLTVLFESLQEPNQHWATATKLSLVSESMVEILGDVARMAFQSVRFPQLLLTTWRLASAVESKLELFCGDVPEQLMTKLMSLLDRYGLPLPQIHNAEQGRKRLLEYFSLKIGGTQAKLLWTGHCKKILDAWKNSRTEAHREAILEVCGSMDSIVPDLHESLSSAARDVLYDLVTAANENSRSVVSSFFRTLTLRGSDTGYKLISSVMENTWPKELTYAAHPVDVLQFLLKWPLAEIFLDDGLIKRQHLSRNAKQLLATANESVREAWNACQTGNVSIGFVSIMRENPARFPTIIRLCDCSDASVIMEALSSVSVNLMHHIGCLNIIRTYLCFGSTEKFVDYADFFEPLNHSIDDQIVSDICQVGANAEFKLKFQLTDPIVRMATRLKELSDNKIFHRYWISAIKHLSYPIPVDDAPKMVMARAEEAAATCLVNLRDLTMKFSTVDDLLSYMTESDRKVQLIQDLCDKLNIDDGAWVTKSYQRIEMYQRLKKCVLVQDGVKVVAGNLGFDQSLEELEELTMLQNEDRRLSELSEELFRSAIQLSQITDKQNNFLLAFPASVQFIEWAREFGDELDFQKFLTIVSPSLGESDHELAIITNASKIVSVCQKLIFFQSTESGLPDLLDALQPLFQALDADDAFGEKLEQVSQDFKSLKDLQEKRLDLEKWSLSEAECINAHGVIEIGCKDKVMKTVDDWIRIRVPDEKKTYKPPALRDLHIRLTLIGAQVGDKAVFKREIKAFSDIYNEILRLAEVCQQHYSAGNVLLTNWTCSFYLDDSSRDYYAEANFRSSLLTSMSTTEKAPVLKEIRALCEMLEAALVEWNQYLRQVRDQFPILNLLTNSQIELLRRRLASTITEDHLDAEAMMMLMAVKKDIQTFDVANTVRAFLLEMEESNGDQISGQQESDVDGRKESFIREIEESGIGYALAVKAAEAVNYSDIDDAINWAMENENIVGVGRGTTAHVGASLSPHGTSFRERMVQEIERVENDDRSLLASKVERIWKTHMAMHEEKTFAEFVSLRCLGHVLQILSDSSKVTGRHPLSKLALKTNEPNLLLTTQDEVYRFVVSIYDCNSEGHLPNFEHVLVCRSSTSPEEVRLFIERVRCFGSSDIFYSVVDVHNLKSDVANQLEESVNDLLMSINRPFYLLIFGAKEKFESHSVDKCRVADGLLRFQRLLEIPTLWNESREVLTKKMASCGWNGQMTNSTPENMATLYQTNMVTSIGYGHGKTLCVQRQFNALQKKFPGAVYTKVPLHDASVDIDLLYDLLQQAGNAQHRLFHLDIVNHQTRGVDTLLFQLFILGGFTTSNGRVWRVLDGDRYVVEITSAPNAWLVPVQSDDASKPLPMRFLFPLVLCHSPTSTLLYSMEEGLLRNSNVVSRYCDFAWLSDRRVQLCHWYLSGAYVNSREARFDIQRHGGADEATVLKILLQNCGIATPSWFELENYVNFLSQQLVACENSAFCKPHLADTFPGFRQFVVRFMKFMARDFATRSLAIAEDISNLEQERFQQLDAYKPKHRWEHQPHPYVFFNKDGNSMSFFGCYFNQNGDLISATTAAAYDGGGRMATQALMLGLAHNGVNLHESFDNKLCRQCKEAGAGLAQRRYCNGCRREKLVILCRVLGVNENNDTDNNYEITADCVMKMLAIKMRMKCGIPVILMGETGCGKTRVIQYLCDLERSGLRNVRNLVLLRMHGGISKQRIEAAVNEALELAKQNSDRYGIPTYLFFDEANTSPNVSLLKEIICDDSINGRKLETRRYDLCVLAAVNPYKKHDDAMIKLFESSGLGYHVANQNVQQTFGTIPLRHLIYRVEPLSPSLIPFVIDFGSLSNDTEKTYIRRMFDRFLQRLVDSIRGWQRVPVDENVTYELLAAIQAWMKDQKDETSFVSLRNIDRTFKVAELFLNGYAELFMKMEENGAMIMSPLIRAVLMAVCVCYRASLRAEKRASFDRHLVQCLGIRPEENNGSSTIVQNEINICQEIFLDGIRTPSNVAKNSALKENLFLMAICIELRIPLFLIGHPGTSKSLAKTIIEENMLGPSSKGDIFKHLKMARLFSFQCSPSAKAEDIERKFREGAVYQKERNLQQEVAVIVADEVGLAEDTLALKSLHGLLEEGVAIDKEILEAFHKVAFVGISNWALDPAKMNRGIFVIRPLPDSAELTETARVICRDEKAQIDARLEILIEPIVSAYLQVYENQRRSKYKLEFFGLRDFYCLMKMLFDIAKKSPVRKTSDGVVHALQYEHVMEAVDHNFSGHMTSINAINIFAGKLGEILRAKHLKPTKPSKMINDNLCGYPSNGRLNRYVLVLTEKKTALHVLNQIETLQNAEVIFGSGFPKDLGYTQVCKNINRIKVCMDRGKTVILLNLYTLYESLYDLLNQAFIRWCGNNFVDLGLGTHRLKCHVHEDFRLVVVAERTDALRKFPAPLINRLEKHFLTLQSELDDHQVSAVCALEKWVENFVSTDGDERVSPENAFVGLNGDTLAALVVDAVDKAKKRGNWSYEDIEKYVKMTLVNCATPETLLRLPLTDLKEEADYWQNWYFRENVHSSFREYLQAFANDGSLDRRLVQVTTHSRLLSRSDRSQLAAAIGVPIEHVHLLNLHLYGTEQEFLDNMKAVYDVASNSHLMQYVVIQCALQESDVTLADCTCYHLEKLYAEHAHLPVHLFFVCSLPREIGGSFIGLRTGIWDCIHIDQVVETAGERIFDLLAMCNKSVSELFEEYVKNREGDADNVNFDFGPLVIDCLQLAAAKLRDQSKRKLERVPLLLDLWASDERFSRIVCHRLLQLLKQLDNKRSDPRNWMLKQVNNLGFIFENSTYAQAIRKIMELDITRLLAGLISVMDVCSNLSALSIDRGHFFNLWMDLFEEDSLLDVQYDEESSLFFDKDSDGILRPREEFSVNSATTFGTPFFSHIVEKIMRVMHSLEETSENWSIGEKVSGVQKCLGLATWYRKLSAVAREPKFLQRYISDIICQKHPSVDRNGPLAKLLMEWLDRTRQEEQYRPFIIGALFACQGLTSRMRLATELHDSSPEAMNGLGALTQQDTTTLARLNFEVDLFMALRICDYLSSRVQKMDTITVMGTQLKERTTWFSLVTRMAPLMQQVLTKPDDRPAYNRVADDWFCIEFCRSFLEHVRRLPYFFKVKPIWDRAKRSRGGESNVRFWPALENGLILLHRSMNQHYQRENTAPDNNAQSALMLFFLDLVFEAFSGRADTSFEPSVGYFLKYIGPKENDTISVEYFSDNDQGNRLDIFRSSVLQKLCIFDLPATLAQIDVCMNHILETDNEQANETMDEFALACVSSIEDSLHLRLTENGCNAVDAIVRNVLDQLDIVNQNAGFWNRFQEEREQLMAADLSIIAKIRFILHIFARLAHKLRDGADPDTRNWRLLMQGIKQLVVQNGTARILLMKFICRHYGRDLLQFCTEQPGPLNWIVDADMFADAESPDPFVIHGATYAAVKHGLHAALFHKDAGRFEQELAKADGIDRSLVPLSLMCALDRFKELALAERATTELILHLAGVTVDTSQILDQWNHVLAAGELASFVWHMTAALCILPNGGVAEFFKDLLISPRGCTAKLFPTMDDALRQAVALAGTHAVWSCPNGHLYVIENCGEPSQSLLCNECRAPIGGGSHVPHAGNTRFTNIDALHPGHILGRAGSFVQTGQRELTRTDVLLIRCMIHSTMIGSVLLNGPTAVAALIVPPVVDGGVVQFLTDHLETDINVLARTFACSRDDVFLVMHQILRGLIEKRAELTNKLELGTQPQRGAWETAFSKLLLHQISEKWRQMIADGRKAITDGAENTFWRMIFEDDNMRADGPERFWYYRPPVTLEALTDQALNSLQSFTAQRDRLEVLRLFLTNMPNLSALRHLLPVRELQKQFISHFHGCISIRFAQNSTIEDFLRGIGDTAALFRPLLNAFFDALGIMFPGKLSQLLAKYAGGRDQVPLITVLPLPTEYGSFSCDLIRALARCQNDLLEAVQHAAGVEDETRPYVDYESVSAGQVISFDAEKEGFELLMSHQFFDGATGVIKFDLDLLQKRIRRFVLGSAAYIRPVFPLMRAKEALMLECLGRLRNYGVHDLTLNQKREIMMLLRPDLAKTRELLDHLEMMIRFSSALEKKDMESLPLGAFLHRLKPAANHPMLNTYMIGHLLPLWQLAAFMVKYLLVDKNIEDPFNELDEKFKEKLPDNIRAGFVASLAGTDVLQLALEMTEFLLLDMHPGCNSAVDRQATLHQDDFADEPLVDYLVNRQGSNLKEFSNQVLIKHAVDAWIVAAKKQAQTLH